MKIFFTTLSFLAIQNTCVKADTPPNWWLNTFGSPIHSNFEFKELVSGKLDEKGTVKLGKLTNKHVFIDFYMEHCYWCYIFQPDWNRLVQEITSTFGEDKVEFIKVDGQQINDVSRKYKV
jgi:hypothetical protein